MVQQTIVYKTQKIHGKQKLYKKPIIKKIVDLFIPKKGTKDYRKVQKLLKDSASKLKMEWLYVNRITLAIVTFIVSCCTYCTIT